MISKEVPAEVPLSRKTLVKVSGDAYRFYSFYSECEKLAEECDELDILVGGGTQISEAFNAAGIEYSFGDESRETESERAPVIATKVLKGNKSYVENRLEESCIRARVLIPVLSFELGDFHINGDTFVKNTYAQYGRVIIFTLDGRVKDFDIPNLTVVHL